MSLAIRAVIALLLSIGFYALALGSAGGLLWLAWLNLKGLESDARFLLFAAGIAAMILWSIFPRPLRFQPAGPRLTRDEQPGLFAEIESVARATGQSMPAEVYLASDVNAGVLQTGGFLGIGSRRVMEIGLPLLQSLTIPQFRAVIAHEFGHYVGGDTTLGPLIHRTRAAIARTVETLGDEDGVVHKPFEWYGKLFLRVTMSISRAQELAADRLAARIGGAKNAAAALVAVRGAAAAHAMYWQNEVVPLLSTGHRAPLAAGFGYYTEVEDVRKTIRETLDAAMQETNAVRYGTHPPLFERLAALGEPLSLASDDDAPRALSLLRDVPRLEEELIRPLLDEPPKPVTWEESMIAAYLPVWQKLAERDAHVFRELTPLALPRIATSLPDFSARLSLRNDDGEQSSAASSIVGGALAVKLHQLGWTCEAMPGRPPVFTREGRRIEPFEVVTRLRSGELDAITWEAECRAAGIDSVPLV